jgi:hypothetical protein
MRVVLRKNKTLDGVDYLKHEVFTLIGYHWTDVVGSDMYYVTSQAGKSHMVDTSLFDYDCRDTKPKP